MHITTSPRYNLMTFTLCLVGQLLNCSKQTIAGEGFWTKRSRGSRDRPELPPGRITATHRLAIWYIQPVSLAQFDKEN